jgi:hypothetical protein
VPCDDRHLIEVLRPGGLLFVQDADPAWERRPMPGPDR